MEIRVLGQIEVLDDQGSVVDLGLRQRQVLALLTANAGDVVKFDTLMEEVWGSDEPRARTSLHTAVSALRAVLGDDAISTVKSGYKLSLDGEAIDAERFARLISEAGTATGEEVVSSLDRSLGEWRGDPYTDVAGDLPSLAPAISRLHSFRRTAIEQRHRAALGVGDAQAIIPELELLVGEQPLHEPFWVLLVEALATAGRPVDALRAYDRIRRLLAEEVGVVPSSELRALEQRILDEGAALEVPEPHPTLFVTSTDGTRVAYKDFGDGRPLLFVSAWAQDMAAAVSHPRGRDYFEAIGRGRRNLWIGYRGAGASQRDVADISIEAREADVEAVLAVSDLREFDIYATGDGVPVALAVAASGRFRVGRLAAYMPQIGMRSWMSSDSMSSFVETMLSSGSFGRRTISDIVLPDEPAADRRWFNTMLQSTISDDMIARALSLQQDIDVGDLVDRVEADVLVVTRRKSNSIRPEIGPELAASVRNGRFVSVPGTSGIPWLGGGDVASVVKSFLDD